MHTQNPLLTNTVDVLFTGDTTVTFVAGSLAVIGLGAGLGATVGFGLPLDAFDYFSYQ